MKFKLYREYGALNSKPVFDAFEAGVKLHGHEIVENGEDVAVIWSVLWQGRMAGNQKIYNVCKALNKPIIILEVGSLKRNETWKVGLGHINNLGFFGNSENLDHERPQKLGLALAPLQTERRAEILIAGQHEHSLQWQGQQSMVKWVQDTVYKLRNHTQRKIVVRPHPRSNFYLDMPSVTIDRPLRVPNTYDDFNIDYNYHCVINFCSGPSMQAAINGVPVICDSTSLASEISEKIENIENLQMPDRTEWFVKLCHTEWTVTEIQQGIPLARLLPKISENLP